jgi:hypothetical protein
MIQQVRALFVLVAFVLTPVTSALGEDDLLGESFEAFTGIPREAAVPLSDDEMDGLRGRYFEVFFGVEFFGRATVDGVLDATLNVNANFFDPATGAIQTGSLAFPNAGAPTGGAPAPIGPNGSTVAEATNPITGDVFRLSNSISNSLGGTGGGVAQIIQNNGSLTTIQNLSITNIAVLNVSEGDLPAARNALNSFFGFGF